MPCYKPLTGVRDSSTGQLKQHGDGEPIEVACGNCLGCRLDRSRMWSARITHEASLHELAGGNCFITLTYDDKHLPQNWSLDKKHFQDFMKRLRKATPQKIRYFHCGEYGNVCQHGIDLENNTCQFCNVGRPHYHAILFNRKFDDLVPFGHKGDHIHYTSTELDRIWGKGLVQVGTVTPESAGYVARYCLKKINGRDQDKHYRVIDNETGEITYLHPEYATMSRGGACEQCGKRSCKNAPGGIGKRFLTKFKDDFYPSGETPILGSTKVIKGTPRYYDSILQKENLELLEQIKHDRYLFRSDNHEEFSDDRLRQKQAVKEAQIKTLKREL